MDAETFTELALRAIAGEATADELATFERELAANPARRDEFEQFAALRTVAPMTHAAQATEPALPAHRVGELRMAVRRHFGIIATGKHTPMLDALRWLFAGGGLVGLAALILVLCLSNRTIEVGLYGSDLMRNGDRNLTAQDVPAAKLVTFDQDTPFDTWQKQPLAWYEHAKIWVDNEHDLLYVTKRIDHGHIVTETQPLATADDPQKTQDAQRAQIQQVVQSLSH